MISIVPFGFIKKFVQRVAPNIMVIAEGERPKLVPDIVTVFPICPSGGKVLISCGG